MKIVFLGTPDFAVASLKATVEAGFDVAGVVTTPDKKAGRGMKLQESAVKKYAIEAGLNVLQPTNLKGGFFLEQLKNLNANLCWTIFPFGNKEWIYKEIKNAEKNKCLAIVLCIDANVRSHRYLDRESRYDARNFGGRTNPLPPNPLMALNFDWQIVKYIKTKTKLPLIIKGVLTYEDTIKSIKNKVDGIWISNHGGRMFNSGISGVDCILEIKKKLPKIKTKILVDGGVRKGSDILKLLCLGADFVGIGRPALHGLILNGYKGVADIFKILNSELKVSMENGGFKNFKDCKISRIKF